MPQSSDPIEISIVVPVYQSEACLEELSGRIQKVMSAIGRSFEVVLVDDGSKDKSWEKILILNQKFPEQVTGILLAENFGQNAATICGIRESKGKSIVTLDDDLQIPPEEIPGLLQLAEAGKHDVVYGICRQKRQPLIRNLGGTILRWIFIFTSRGFVPGSSFRLIGQTVAETIKEQPLNSEFLDLMIHRITRNIGYLPVEHHRRKSGKSGYSLFKLIRTGIQVILQLLGLTGKSATKPLYSIREQA